MNIRNKVTGFFEILKFNNWLAIIMQTVFRPHSQLFIYRVDGNEYVLNKSAGNIPVFRSIVKSNEYRPIIGELKNLL